MNVEPFLIASTLQVLMAQRLVRKICDRCRASITMSKADLIKKFKVADQYFSLDKNVLYEGKGCEMCNHTGYHGRTAIYEFIDINPAMEDLIVRKPSSKEIWSLARSYGAKTMFEDGILKVKEGVTTLAELLRVAEPPEFV
jgi:type II secretory ATPase GspE/PulE/Tfp pilus assembly ATPase PilB-like protein